MRIEVIQCEVCAKIQPYSTPTTQYVLPDSWLTVKEGDSNKEQHFCSDACLVAWLRKRGDALFDRHPPLMPQEQPACKARRFLLVDGETAELVDGIKWGNGSVTLEGDTPFQSEHFTTWDALKAHYDGSGVQWIDQEVAE